MPAGSSPLVGQPVGILLEPHERQDFPDAPAVDAGQLLGDP